MLNKIINMAFIDLKKIYRGTLLGWFWVIAKPVTSIFVYWFAFAIGLRANSMVNGHQYFFWLVSGIIPWIYISEILSISPGIFKKYNYLVTKMKFPVGAIPFFSSLSRMFVNVIVLIIFALLYIVFDKISSINIIQLISIVIINFTFMSFLSVSFGLIGSISKDISEFIKTTVTPILFLSPIFWDIKSINVGWLIKIQNYNPFAFIISGYRNIFIYNKPFYNDIESTIIFCCILVINIAIASILFQKLKKELPDYL